MKYSLPNKHSRQWAHEEQEIQQGGRTRERQRDNVPEDGREDEDEAGDGGG